MSDDYKIYVDAGQPATLNDGAGALTDCATLQEAVLAWQRLASEQVHGWLVGRTIALSRLLAYPSASIGLLRCVVAGQIGPVH